MRSKRLKIALIASLIALTACVAAVVVNAYQAFWEGLRDVYVPESGAKLVIEHMKANNGILVIDDFGRQRMQPRELLNRWIVPLDRRVDYLSWFGPTFEIPFELIVVFATNLDVKSLAEEAFIRRIKNKIRIDKISEQTFLEILKRQCQQRGIEYFPAAADYALRECLERSKDGLRACYPRDLLDLVFGIAAFERQPAKFGFEEVDRAVNLYFAV